MRHGCIAGRTPAVDGYICTADGGLIDLEEDFMEIGLRHRHLQMGMAAAFSFLQKAHKIPGKSERKIPSLKDEHV